MNNNEQHVFIVGSKGIPAKYGGFETFVDKLTENKKNKEIKYHVACIVDKNEYDAKNAEFEYNGAHCFNIKAMDIGAAKAIFYDIDAIKYSIKYIKNNKIENPIIYVLACRIGPFIGYYKSQIKKLGGKLYVNPDGHEWKRAKWSAPIRKYWKISERLMVKNADLLICDSKNIEKYIHEDYRKYAPKTTYIAYGAETTKSTLSDDSTELFEWYNKFGIQKNEYYLVVGRFVPENNYETMIREFIRSSSKKDFAIITTADEGFLEKLKERVQFENDKRIKFVGTVYDQELLKKIRENAYAYMHGHEVGGTNPSLLEALGSTKLNLLLNVGFNKEVGENGALYWNKEEGDLARVIEQAEKMSDEEIAIIGEKAKSRIEKEYSWRYIVDEYEKLFCDL